MDITEFQRQRQQKQTLTLLLLCAVLIIGGLVVLSIGLGSALSVSANNNRLLQSNHRLMLKCAYGDFRERPYTDPKNIK